MNLDYSFVFCSGVIRTALGPGDMDREQREHYQVVIEAKDMGGQRGGLTGSTVVKITLTDVNDNPPHFTQSKTAAQTKHSVCIRVMKHTQLLIILSSVLFLISNNSFLKALYIVRERKIIQGNNTKKREKTPTII